MQSKGNAVIYLRVGTAKQLDGCGLQAQEEMCREYAKKNGYKVIKVYSDNGKSGLNDEIKDRPAFFEMINCEQNPPVDVVLVCELSRIGHTPEIFYSFKSMINKQGMTLLSVKEGEDTSQYGTMGKIIESLLVAMNELEVEKLKARTSHGRAARHKEGKKSCGANPLGYKSVKGVYEIVPDEAEIVRTIFKLKKQGLSLRAIAAALPLTKKGKPYSYGTVNDIIKNRRTYEGELGLNDVWVKGEHEAILKKGEYK